MNIEFEAGRVEWTYLPNGSWSCPRGHNISDNEMPTGLNLECAQCRDDVEREEKTATCEFTMKEAFIREAAMRIFLEELRVASSTHTREKLAKRAFETARILADAEKEKPDE